MAGQRDLAEVLERLIAVIPIDQVDLIHDLHHARTDALYQPPEMMWAVWRTAADALAEHVGEPTEPWQLEAQRIFTGVSP